MESLEKTNTELEKLYDVEDKLFKLLEHAGQDSETKYKQKHLDLLEDLKALRSGLEVLLDNHNDTIMELEFVLEG